MRRVVVVGGGTAGYFAALSLRQAFPALDITLVESSKIPIVGVGEATTTLMPPFLHRQLGIDIVDLYRKVRPTWKLGVRFEWGSPGHCFSYPFGATSPIEAYAHDRSIVNQSVCSLMMETDRTPIVTGDDGEPISLLPQMKFAYHLDNKSFVAFLSERARERGIRHIDAEIVHIATDAARSRVAHLVLDGDRELSGDLYIDASGFGSLLIEQALGSPFVSFASSLFCDSAVVGEVPQRGVIRPYTTAETMDAGWCWRIPVEGEDHRGYVYSSAHLDVEQARAEMEARNPGLGETWTLRFRSGRHGEFWKGNTVAIGNAYGFVEPLQSTALHMVIVELAYVIGALQEAGESTPDPSFANRNVASHWDFLRWFLAIHYKYNHRVATPFWQDCRARVDVSGVQELLDRFATIGPWDSNARERYATGDPAFSFQGMMIMLLGQDVPCPPATRTHLSAQRWQERVAASRALVERALPQQRALELLRQRPDLLRELVDGATSWINIGGELMGSAGSSSGVARPQSNATQDLYRAAYGHLLEAVV